MIQKCRFFNSKNKKPVVITFANGGRIQYLYNATGQKIRKLVYANSTDLNNYTKVEYLTGFQYTNNVLNFFPHAEGYVNVTFGRKGAIVYNYVYQYKDHLGNNRLSYTVDPSYGDLTILEENHYYPFGLKHTSYNTTKYEFVEVEDGANYFINIEQLPDGYSSAYNYKYNGKEFQDELRLNMYDYGARNYDPAIGRWMNIDPLAEKFIAASSYAYVANNPVIYKDPDGMDIYRYDYKTGDIVLMESTKDKFDQIVKFNYNNKTGKYEIDKNKKDGSNKVQVDNIAKGILSDGINFREENNTIAVNGTNEDGSAQPTTEDVEKFVVGLSDLVQKEITGYGLGSIAGSEEENILVWMYKNNKFDKAQDIPYNLNSMIMTEHLNLMNWSHDEKMRIGKSRYAKYHFHSHPSGQRHVSKASDDDKQRAASVDIPHYIITSNKNQQAKYEYDKYGSK